MKNFDTLLSPTPGSESSSEVSPGLGRAECQHREQLPRRLGLTKPDSTQWDGFAWEWLEVIYCELEKEQIFFLT